MLKWRNLKEARKADDGAILALWGVSFAALLGIVAMSFDLGRINTTQTELQSFADNVALAAAGELDGNPNAITNATAAAANMISDLQTYGNANNTLQGAGDYTLTFLSDLPASDTAATNSVTTNPEEARYVRVDVVNTTVDLTFGAAFTALTGAGGPNNVVNARAVAGYKFYACDVTSMFFCLPSPTWDAAANIGATVLLRSRGQGAGWGPGDFGFLDPTQVTIDPNGVCAGLSGAKLYQCMHGGEGQVTQCFEQNGVDLQPGQQVGLANAAYNTRFDWFTNSIQPNNPQTSYFTAAPNVISQYYPNGGTCMGNNPPVDPTEFMELPPDDCMPGCGRFGDGDWTVGRTNYEAITHNGAPPVVAAGATRWQYYLAEIAAGGGVGGVNPLLPQPKPGGVTGRPRCTSNVSTTPYRRTFVAAGIDCVGNNIQGSETNVPVLQFVEMFMLSPATQNGASPPQVDMYVEIIDKVSVPGGANGLFHDFVQLYR